MEGPVKKTEAVTASGETEKNEHERNVALFMENKDMAGMLAYIEQRDLVTAARATKEASVDSLTGLPNRGSFLEDARRKLAKVEKDTKFAEENRARPELAQRRAHERGNETEGTEHYSIIILDLDKFKNINDELGHPAGDKVLKRVGEILLQNLRPEDAIGRIGGEEFMIAVSAPSPEAGRVVADKIREAIESAVIEYGHTRIKVTASFGVATWHSSDTLDNIMKRADVALYNAKKNGRNQVAEAEKI